MSEACPDLLRNCMTMVMCGRPVGLPSQGVWSSVLDECALGLRSRIFVSWAVCACVSKWFLSICLFLCRNVCGVWSSCQIASGPSILTSRCIRAKAVLGTCIYIYIYIFVYIHIDGCMYMQVSSSENI